MINKNTLRFLNKNAFGADIDSLESYIVDYKQASLLTDLSQYEDTFTKLYSILKEIKNTSEAFKDTTSLEIIENDIHDSLFEAYTNERPSVAYGRLSSKLENFKNILDNSKDSSSDIIGIINIEGIDIKCTYTYGYLNKIYAIGEYCKYLDLTDLLKSNTKGYIKELKDYKLVELRGKISLPKDVLETLQHKYINIPCYITKLIRLNINTSDIDIIYNDIFIDTNGKQELPYDNQWELMDFIDDLELNVVSHVLLRSIDRENLGQALIEIDNHFEQNDETINYKYDSIEVRINKNIYKEDSTTRVIYNSKKCDTNQQFNATIKSISTTYTIDGMVHKINITDTQCNDKLQVNNIDVDDVYIIETNQLSPGKKIKFNVINGIPIIAN